MDKITICLHYAHAYFRDPCSTTGNGGQLDFRHGVPDSSSDHLEISRVILYPMNVAFGEDKCTLHPTRHGWASPNSYRPTDVLPKVIPIDE